MSFIYHLNTSTQNDSPSFPYSHPIDMLPTELLQLVVSETVYSSLEAIGNHGLEACFNQQKELLRKRTPDDPDIYVPCQCDERRKEQNGESQVLPRVWEENVIPILASVSFRFRAVVADIAIQSFGAEGPDDDDDKR